MRSRSRALLHIGIILAFVTTLLATAVIASPAYAVSSGTYVATATPHYAHPHTGKIEDSGGDGSATLGQAMTESATANKALVEVDSAGNTYVTVRLQLMDNIKNPGFTVDGSNTQVQLMQENASNNTADYRIFVRNTNSVIRCTMYVTAMGRDVVFYITVGNLKAGQGDFIASIKTASSAGAGAASSGSKNSAATNSSSSGTLDAQPGQNADGANGEISPIEEGQVDENGQLISDSENPEASGVTDANGDDGMLMWIIFDAVLAAAVIGVGAWYFISRKKKVATNAASSASDSNGHSSRSSQLDQQEDR